jgi:hypothetical protein
VEGDTRKNRGEAVVAADCADYTELAECNPRNPCNPRLIVSEQSTEYFADDLAHTFAYFLDRLGHALFDSI